MAWRLRMESKLGQTAERPQWTVCTRACHRHAQLLDVAMIMAAAGGVAAVGIGCADARVDLRGHRRRAASCLGGWGKLAVA